MKNKLTKYEHNQVKHIKKWKSEEPSVINKAMGVIIEPAAWLIRKIVPDAAIKGALTSANAIGSWTADQGDIIRDGKVKNISDLKTKSLTTSDRLANEVHNWAIGLAVTEGAGTGFFGIFGAPVDIPAIITIAFRTIHKIGLCYGYENLTKNDKTFAFAILAASSPNTMEEKLAALTTLRAIEVIIAKQTWKKMIEIAAKERLSKSAAIIAIKNLAKQLGINITKRKALSSIPVIGAAIGGSINGWYIGDVSWAARRAFQERWLIDNKKVSKI